MTKDARNDKEVVKLRDEANQLLFKSEEVAKVTTPEEEGRAVEFLSQTKRRFKIVDEKRKQYVKPLKEVIDNINADFKSILEPLKEVEGIVKKGMTEYRNAEEFKAKEAARIEAERVAQEAAKEIQRDGLTDENMEDAQKASKALTEASVEAPKVVSAPSGKASFRKDWKFEIEDASKLPDVIIREILELALKKGLYDQVIRKMVKSGIHAIDGCKIWEESTPIIRS